MNIVGYELLKEEQLNDIHSKGYYFRHKKSGARVCVIANDDDNKVFHITFRTPPTDSTGVAHILEHSVLCGSKNFPSKDPFVELAKGSLNTFLNAMTYPDKTMYPVASCNHKDFANLMNVYMDAVLYPNIYQKEEIFRQEGWHYELENETSELSYNGVVYNEMKGAFSSPDDVLDREILNSLYPDTAYGNESGGDPAFIPDLTYTDFLEFHSKYYHPANSYIYLYGDIDIAERLGWLDREYLSHYDVIPVTSKIDRQPAFSQSREIYRKYPVANSEPIKDSTYLSYNVSIGTSLDVELANAFAVIEYALLSAPGAPLKQILLDKKLGKDITGSYDSGIYQPMFSIVAKNSEASKKEEFIQTIRETLAEIVKAGIDKKALQAGINYMEFRFREADFGAFPKGLMYGIDLMDSWLYDEEQPFAYLHQLQIFEILKEKIGTSYFEELIEEHLLKTNHVSVVVVEPERGLAAKTEQALKEKLAQQKASFRETDIADLMAAGERLQIFQETPSSEEDLQKIPLLAREDLTGEVKPFSNEEYHVADTLLLHHDVQTNGIAYLDFLFDTKYVKQEHIPYVGILKATLGMIDTENYSYGELFNEINIRTGGISSGTDLFTNRKDGTYLTTFTMKSKTLYQEIPFVLEMMTEIIHRSKLDDEKRLYEIVAQLKSRLQARLNAAGHSTAVSRAMAYYADASAFSESISGISFYKLIESIEENFEAKKSELIVILKELVQCIFRKDTLSISCTAKADGCEVLKGVVTEFVAKLPAEALPVQKQIQAIGKRNEGFKTSAKVQYVARAGNFCQAGFAYTGALRVLKTILSYEYLWQNIRVKGGAYGCMSGFGPLGNTYFVSYRDPNLSATNQVYEGITEYVRNFTVSPRDMTKYIIGTMSEMETPLTPMATGLRSLNAYFCNVEINDLQKERDEVLKTNEVVIRGLADIIKAVLDQNYLCVVGNEDKLSEEQELFNELQPFVGEESN